MHQSVRQLSKFKLQNFTVVVVIRARPKSSSWPKPASPSSAPTEHCLVTMLLNGPGLECHELSNHAGVELFVALMVVLVATLSVA